MGSRVPAPIGAAVLLLSACGAPSDPPPPRGDATYIGEAECRHCHLDIATTYEHTGMGRSWYRLTPEVVVEDFTRNNEIEVPGRGLRYRMLERDGRYFMRQFVARADGGEIAVDERELVWVIGSNNHSRSYVTTIGEKLFQAPVCWYPDAALWDLCPGFEHDSRHFAREITETCVFCHNGRMELAGRDVSSYRAIPEGIGCERCHGPGSRHAERWRVPGATPSDSRDDTIVNPRRLSSALRNQVCFQCHLGDSKATTRVTRHDRSLLDFRPGQELGEVMVPFHYETPLERDFGISAQADRMILSRCYTESGGRLECITCHNPHVTVYHPDRPADLFRRACLRCHDSDDCGEEHAVRQRGDGPADDCVRCHMRVAEPDDQLHTTITDHWIRRSLEVDDRERRTSLTIRPVFPEQFTRLPDAEREFYRGRANLLLSTRTADPARKGMWLEAARAFGAAIEGGAATPDAWFFLGKARGWLGRPREALAAYREVVARDPDHHDGMFALGQTLGSSGDVQGAARVFEQLLSRHPGSGGAIAELGRFRILAGRLAEGVELYTRAIAVEPWNASLYLNRGKGLALMRRFDEAARDAASATRLDPESPDNWVFYEGVMRAAGRGAEAAEAKAVLERLGGAR